MRGQILMMMYLGIRMLGHIHKIELGGIELGTLQPHKGVM